MDKYKTKYSNMKYDILDYYFSDCNCFNEYYVYPIYPVSARFVWITSKPYEVDYSIEKYEEVSFRFFFEMLKKKMNDEV